MLGPDLSAWGKEHSPQSLTLGLLLSDRLQGNGKKVQGIICENLDTATAGEQYGRVSLTFLDSHLESLLTSAIIENNSFIS